MFWQCCPDLLYFKYYVAFVLRFSAERFGLKSGVAKSKIASTETKKSSDREHLEQSEAGVREVQVNQRQPVLQ